MLLKANWKEGKWQGQEVNRGQFISSIKKISEQTGLTESEVKTALKNLKKSNEIASKGTNKNTVFTVKNYDKYQSVSQQTDDQLAINSPPISEPLATIEEREERKEGKKERKKKNKEPEVAKPYFPSDDLLNKTFLEFIEHRKAIKKPMTEIAITKMITKLNKYSRGVAITSLDKSIENGWQGVFPEKESEPITKKEETGGQIKGSNAENERDDSAVGRYLRGEVVT